MNDRLLDAFLEEACGGAQPPDLTDKVLAALASPGEGARRSTAPVSPIPVLACPAGAGPVLANAARQKAQATRGTFGGWLPVAMAASLLLAVAGYWMLSHSKTKESVIAERAGERPPVKQPAPHIDTPLLPDSAQVVADERSSSDERPSPIAEKVVSSDAGVGRQGNSPAEKLPEGNVPDEEMLTPREQPTTVAENRISPPIGEFDSSTAGDAVAATSLPSALSTSATTDAQVTAYINAVLKSHWSDAGVRPSPAATESEWCRRVYLDCIGRIPTVEELEVFLIDNRRDKRRKLVERLLDDDLYLETYARFWTTLWTNILIGRTGGMEPDSPVYREGLQQFLRRSFLTNKPYNQFVYELVSAKGTNRPVEVASAEAPYNGAVNFLLQHMQERATPATAKTAQVFLGLQVQCTQCHNHPFNHWKQSRFWELNAFFRQAREEQVTTDGQPKVVRLLDGDFAGEGASSGAGDRFAEAEVYFERNGILQVAYPTFVDGTAIDPNGMVSVVDRRLELARLVSRSDELKQAIVNRMWGHFFGYGFTKPVDDLGPHNPPSHPELLARLADEFAGHGYDLKRLIRWITLSDAYALSSKFGPKLGNAADDPTLGNAPLFSHFYVRQMSAEQLYESLLVATGAHRTLADYEEQQRLKDRWLEQFAIAFGTDENDEATTFDGTITQTLVMMNGELTRQATNGESGSFLSQVAMKSERTGKPERAAALNELYLAALARRPSRAEVQVANDLLVAQSGNTTTALEDIWWALLNSNEFILNH
ncbi:MAG TPA: DUF1549 domain-containing protein [Pirellulales bacterium]|nr:DUF1549 domain-containing protein [Pirellulales bacterium]